MAFRSGFVSIIGRPNAGKSTLLNALTGTKLAIVASQPQTTRTAVEGVLTTPDSQIVFLDTPGIHKSTTLLNKRMMNAVRAALDARDLVLYLVDASVSFSEQDAQAVDVLKNSETPAVLVLNKIDRLEDKTRLLPLIERFHQVREFVEYLPLSARSGEGLDKLRQCIRAHLPEGGRYFPADYLTDQPERFLAAELIREQILRQTRQEVPHAVAVLVEKWEEKKNLTRILATIFVERDGQKAILIGAKAAMLKKIGTEARRHIEELLSTNVFLELFVKVRPRWREDARFLESIEWKK